MRIETQPSPLQPEMANPLGLVGEEQVVAPINPEATVLGDEERADWQAVLDTRKSKPVLLPTRMQTLMKTHGPQDGDNPLPEQVIWLYNQAKAHLEHGTPSEAYGEVARLEKEAATNTNFRASRAAGPSPYATGDGFIHVTEKSRHIESGGVVRSGTGELRFGRRPTRAIAQPSPISPNASKTEAEVKGISHRRDDIKDLITLDKTGRARYQSGVKKGRNIKGRFITTHELDTIAANKEQILDGLAARGEASASVTNENHNQADTPAVEQKPEPRTFGIWTKEQDEAIEYLKQPVQKSRHNMKTRTGRMAYFAENHMISGEKAKVFVGILGHAAVESMVKLNDAGLEFEKHMQPKVVEASKTSVRHARHAVRRGVALDAEMIRRGVQLDRKIGALLLAEVQKHDVIERSKRVPQHAKRQGQKFSDWLNEKDKV